MIYATDRNLAFKSNGATYYPDPKILSKPGFSCNIKFGLHTVAKGEVDQTMNAQNTPPRTPTPIIAPIDIGCLLCVI